MAKKKLLEFRDPVTMEKTLVFKGLPKKLMINSEEPGHEYEGTERSLINSGIIQSHKQMDIAQNIGFRTIYNRMGFKSTELNRAAYNCGTLVFYRNPETGRMNYVRGVATEFHDSGVPKKIKGYPVFKLGNETGHTVEFDYGYPGLDTCVLWHDVPPLTNTLVTQTMSRAVLNGPFLDLSAKILQKMEKQLILSGTRLVAYAKDTSSIPVLKQQLQDLIHEDDIVQVVGNILEVDARVLSMNPEVLGYMQILQDLNQYRQYMNGFGQGQFGTFKKERLLTGEIEQNEGNTNLIHMARVMFDKEWVSDMKTVFNEDIMIEYNGANMGGRGF